MTVEGELSTGKQAANEENNLVGTVAEPEVKITTFEFEERFINSEDNVNPVVAVSIMLGIPALGLVIFMVGTKKRKKCRRKY